MYKIRFKAAYGSRLKFRHDHDGTSVVVEDERVIILGDMRDANGKMVLPSGLYRIDGDLMAIGDIDMDDDIVVMNVRVDAGIFERVGYVPSTRHVTY